MTPDEYNNLLTVAWTGTVCSDPPMCYISVRPERHSSYAIIRRTGEFVINLTTRRLARAADWCGVRSGRDTTSSARWGLTAVASKKVAAPVVAESPVNIECRVRQVLPLGTHDMFLAEVVGVQADEAISTLRRAFSASNADPIVYSHGSILRWARRWGISAGRSAKENGPEGSYAAFKGGGRSCMTAAGDRTTGGGILRNFSYLAFRNNQHFPTMKKTPFCAFRAALFAGCRGAGFQDHARPFISAT